MKEIIEVLKGICLLGLFLVGLLIVAIAFRESPQSPVQICESKGGIPIMNWNNSKLKNCILK